jgi:hypothetical protein
MANNQFNDTQYSNSRNAKLSIRDPQHKQFSAQVKATLSITTLYDTQNYGTTTSITTLSIATEEMQNSA